MRRRRRCRRRRSSNGDQAARASNLAQLHAVWAKADGDLRSFAKGQAPADPDYAAQATELHGRCSALLSLATRAAYADLLAQGLDVGRDYARAYSLAKRRVGAGAATAFMAGDRVRDRAAASAFP